MDGIYLTTVHTWSRGIKRKALEDLKKLLKAEQIKRERGEEKKNRGKPIIKERKVRREVGGDERKKKKRREDHSRGQGRIKPITGP